MKNHKQRSRERFLKKKGLFKEPPNVFYRTEDSVKYQYNGKIMNMHAKWAAEQRCNNVQYPKFRDFVHQLSEDLIKQIVVLNIYRYDGDTNTF